MDLDLFKLTLSRGCFLGVIGNLTSAKLLDLSYNKLHDLTSDPDFFRLPPNISDLLLGGNELTELPWMNLKNVSHLKFVDLKDNLLDQIAQNASELIMSGTEIAYEGTSSCR